jgi:D-aminoacyl-tRNA deacylase
VLSFTAATLGAVRAVLQRVREASVDVAGERVAESGYGLLVLLGVAVGDAPESAARLAAKVAELRVFEDERGRFDRSLVDVGGNALVVSQFTLLGDTSKGRRPSFTAAAPPDLAEPLYEEFCTALARHGVRVARGVFGARMAVSLVNDGPVTIIVEV